MRFSTAHARAFIGNNITVMVEADQKETISSVSVSLDGRELDAFQVQSGTESYSQEFPAVGSASAGTDHTLIVTAVDGDGAPHSSVTRWTDVL
jgi:hypothetical protein